MKLPHSVRIVLAINLAAAGYYPAAAVNSKHYGVRVLCLYLIRQTIIITLKESQVLMLNLEFLKRQNYGRSFRPLYYKDFFPPLGILFILRLCKLRYYR